MSCAFSSERVERRDAGETADVAGSRGCYQRVPGTAFFLRDVKSGCFLLGVLGRGVDMLQPLRCKAVEPRVCAQSGEYFGRVRYFLWACVEVRT